MNWLLAGLLCIEWLIPYFIVGRMAYALEKENREQAGEGKANGDGRGTEALGAAGE